jgi:hypothetical protein
VAANRIAKWDGVSWSPLGSGILGAFVWTLKVYDDGNGPALYAGGYFSSAPDSGDSYLARWGGPGPDLDPPVLSCPQFVQAWDVGPPGEVVTFTVTASDCRDSSPIVACVPPSGSFFPRGTTLVACTATDAAGHQSSCEFPVTVALKARRR